MIENNVVQRYRISRYLEDKIPKIIFFILSQIFFSTFRNQYLILWFCSISYLKILRFFHILIIGTKVSIREHLTEPKSPWGHFPTRSFWSSIVGFCFKFSMKILVKLLSWILKQVMITIMNNLIEKTSRQQRNFWKRFE